jgi:hydroxymethylglutaryl-CoA lyase
MTPKRVVIEEVGPRDGFQNISEFIPTEFKIDIIERLSKAGLSRIQVASFVSPKAIPQMRDAADVTKEVLRRCPNTAFFALVPNLRGAQGAVDAGLKEISIILSLSEAHNKANVGKTVEESIVETKRIRQELPDVKITQDIATVFGCPFAGKMEIPPLLDLLGKLSDLGINDFTLCDTIGIAYPSQVVAVLRAVQKTFPQKHFGIHIHDTRNMGILNSYVAIQNGVVAVQSTIGGLGGCPFAPGASGNTSTEDLVYLLSQDGCDTGVDFLKLLEVAKYLHEHVKGNYSGHHINISQSCSAKIKEALV